jgi:hypothetical protein
VVVSAERIAYLVCVLRAINQEKADNPHGGFRGAAPRGLLIKWQSATNEEQLLALQAWFTSGCDILSVKGF